MDRRSSFARAAAHGLLSGLSLVACSTTQRPTTPSAPMDPVMTTGPNAASVPGPRGVGPAPPPLPVGTVRPAAPRAARENEREKACCRGMNECKGKGGCADSNHDCAGMNECKGTSTGCAPDPAAAGPDTSVTP